MKRICILLAILAVLFCGCTPREKKEAYLAQNQAGTETEKPETAVTADAITYKQMEGEPEVYLYKQYGLWGLADKDKQPLTEPRFNEVRGFFGDYAVCSVFDYTVEPQEDLSSSTRYSEVWGVINRKGEIVVPFKYSWMDRQQDGRYFVRENDLAGVMEIDGTMIVEPKYWDIEEFKNGYAIVAREDFTHDTANQQIAKLYYGLINEVGEEILPLEYDQMQWNMGMLSAAKKSEVEQYSIMGGELVKQGDVSFFVSVGANEGFDSKICDDPEIHVYEMLDLCGLADAEGKAITPPEFAEINSFRGSYAPAAKLDYTADPVDASGKLEYPKYFGVIDTEGNTVLDFKYNRTTLSEDGRTVYVDETTPIAAINDDGSVTLLEAAEEAARQAVESKKKTMVDILQEAELPREDENEKKDMPEGANWSDFRLEEGDPDVYAFARGELWGLADADANTLIEAKFEVLDPFEGDFAVAGYTDYNAEPKDISGAEEYPRVYGVINRRGETVVDFVYEKMLRQDGGFYIMERDGLQGLISSDGTVLLEPTFKSIYDFSDHYALVQNIESYTQSDGAAGSLARYGLINDLGEILLLAEYDRIEIKEGELNRTYVIATRAGEISQYAAADGGIVRLEGDGELSEAEFIEKKLCSDPEIYSYSINGLTGMISVDGTVITGPEYADIGSFADGYAIARKFDFDAVPMYFSGDVEYPEYWGVIDIEGNAVEEFTHEKELKFAGEGRIIRYGGKNEWGGETYGYKVAGGEIITEAKYMVAGDFVNGYAVVAEFEVDYSTANDDSSSGPDGTYYFGVINAGGEEVVPLEYQEQVYTDDGSIALRKSGKVYYFDFEKAEMVSEPNVQQGISHYVTRKICDNPEIYVYEVGDLLGLASADGAVISEAVFSYINQFADGYAVAAKFDYTRPTDGFSGVTEYAQLWGVIDPQGNAVEDFVYEGGIAVTGEGRILRFNGKDASGYEVSGYKWIGGDVFVEPQYYVGGDFREGLALVAEFEPNGGADTGFSGPEGTYYFGVIDTQGEIVLPLEYTDCEDWYDGSFVLKRGDEKFHYKFENGKVVELKQAKPSAVPDYS